MQKIIAVILLTVMLFSTITIFPADSAFAVNKTVSISGTIAATISTIPPLHIEGNSILDGNNVPIVLHGVNYPYFVTNPSGSWILPNGQAEWNTWDQNAVANNLDAIKAWGGNCIRILATTQWWTSDTDNFRSKIETFISMAGERGIYVDLTFWRNNETGIQTGIPYPPYDAGNNVINSTTDFVNLWTNIANSLKNYPNIFFELWNEPHGATAQPDSDPLAEASWFEVTQQCITAIRGTGATNLIVVQWGFGFGYDFTYNVTYNLNWVKDYPLNDSHTNLLYSMHIYRQSFYNDFNGDQQNLAYTAEDMTEALTADGFFNMDKALWIGEIGASLFASNITNEYTWYDNTLSILNQYGIGYCGWVWWGTAGSTTEYSLISEQPNYAPNQAGQIFQQKIANP